MWPLINNFKVRSWKGVGTITGNQAMGGEPSLSQTVSPLCEFTVCMHARNKVDKCSTGPWCKAPQDLLHNVAQVWGVEHVMLIRCFAICVYVREIVCKRCVWAMQHRWMLSRSKSPSAGQGCVMQRVGVCVVQWQMVSQGGCKSHGHELIWQQQAPCPGICF